MPEQTSIEAEILDERTKEIIPRGANEIPVPTEQKTIINVHQIGVLDVDEKAIEAITSPLDETDVQIRPDGLVYLPWTWRAKRLNEAFGIFKWGMIPQGAPMSRSVDDKTVLVVWGWWLVVKGVPVAFSYGETSYRPSNKTMSYADACEGAKSNALSRNCKQIGMPDIELYNQDWVREWKTKHAERVKNPDGNYPEFIWRKKGQKSAQKSEASKAHSTESQQEAPQSTESPESAKDAPEPQKSAPSGLQVKDLKMAENVVKIKDGSGKDIPTVMKTINGLDKSQTYTIEQVVEMVKAG